MAFSRVRVQLVAVQRMYHTFQPIVLCTERSFGLGATTVSHNPVTTNHVSLYRLLADLLRQNATMAYQTRRPPSH